jgi:hypothetical protein
VTPILLSWQPTYQPLLDPAGTVSPHLSCDCSAHTSACAVSTTKPETTQSMQSNALHSPGSTLGWPTNSCTDCPVSSWKKVWEPQTGDVHFYTTVDNPLVITTFPRARFISEFGFQSFASFKSYKAMSAPEDWSYQSKATAFRSVPSEPRPPCQITYRNALHLATCHT